MTGAELVRGLLVAESLDNAEPKYVLVDLRKGRNDPYDLFEFHVPRCFGVHLARGSEVVFTQHSRDPLRQTPRK